MDRLVGNVVHTLRGHPFALVILIINVLFIVASTYTLWSIGKAGERRDTLIAQMAKDCMEKRDGDQRR